MGTSGRAYISQVMKIQLPFQFLQQNEEGKPSNQIANTSQCESVPQVGHNLNHLHRLNLKHLGFPSKTNTYNPTIIKN